MPRTFKDIWMGKRAVPRWLERIVVALVDWSIVWREWRTTPRVAGAMWRKED